jgi:hypothetical protein
MSDVLPLRGSVMGFGFSPAGRSIAALALVSRDTMRYQGHEGIICKQVWPNGNRKWVVHVAEDGGDYGAVAPVRFYDTKAECKAIRDRLDHAENGKT